MPTDLSSQPPPAEEAEARLMHYRRSDRAVTHRAFSDLPELLRPGDLLVFNDARVVQARFTLHKPTGGRVEGLFLSEVRPGRWHVLLKNLGAHAGGRLYFASDPALSANVAMIRSGGEYELDIRSTEPAAAV